MVDVRRASHALLLVLVAMAACGDDEAASSGSGGGGGATSTAGSSTASSSASSPTSVSSTASSTGGGGQTPDCPEIDLTLDGHQLFGPLGAPQDLTVVLDVDPQIGGAGADVAIIEVRSLIDYHETEGRLPGDFDLASEGEGDTCVHCVFVLEDDGDDEAPTYFQESGTFRIEPGAQPALGTGSITLEDVVLREAIVDPDDRATTFVEGGGCVLVRSATVQLTRTTCGVLADYAEEAIDCLESADGCCDALDACTDGGADPGGCTSCLVGDGDPERCAEVFSACHSAGCLVPPEWTCDEAAYWTGEVCDCDCGVLDLDCFDEDLTMTGCPDGGRCGDLTPECVPAEWTCPALYYGDGQVCACSCGALDPDCEDPDAVLANCQDGQTCSEAGACEGLPEDWSCDASAFADGTTCDCACGGTDPDCDEAGRTVVGCEDGEICLDGGCAPAGWTCPADWYEDGSCDCGCGVPDLGCADASEASCDTCNCDTGEWCSLDEVVDGDSHLCAR